MLYVVREDTVDGSLIEDQYHVGGKDQKLVYVSSVRFIQADGDELDAIRDQFTGIPMLSGPIVRWDGDIARFIASNIRL